MRAGAPAGPGLGLLLAVLLVLLAVGPAHAGVVAIGGGFNAPNGVAVDASGNVFVADTGNGRVKKIPAGCSTAACVVTLGGSFTQPNALSLDSLGNLFVTDAFNGSVTKLTQASGYATAVPIATGFSFPTGIAVDGEGNVFVADFGANRLIEIVAASGYAVKFTLNLPFGALAGVAVDSHGNLFTTDQNNGIQEITAASGYTTRFNLASGNQNVVQPTGIALDSQGNLYYTDVALGGLFEISIASGYQSVTSRAGGFAEPEGVAVGASGDLYVADPNSGAGAIDEVVAATLTSLITSGSPSAFGASVTFTAAVAYSASVGGAPTGTVTFLDGSNTLGVVGLTGTSAAFTTTTLGVGGHSISAAYSGDSVFAASTSAAVTQTVGSAATTVSLSLSPNPPIVGQMVTLTAFVPGVGGTVTFSDGTTTLATVNVVSGMASYSLVLTSGAHAFKASYSGDANFAASTGTTLNVGTNPAAPIAGPVNATVQTDSVNNTIPLNLSGGAADSVAVGAPPSHGTATAAGTSITYTPTAGYSGPDSFTYTAANTGGTSSAATVDVTVTSNAPPPNIPTLGPWALALLAGALGGAALWRRRVVRPG